MLHTFADNCYEHEGDRDPEEKVTSVGGVASSSLADLAGDCIMDNTKSEPNVTACAEMMAWECSTTDLPSGKPNSKTQKTDQWEETTHAQFVFTIQLHN